jgi:hypothetical protein
MTLSHPIPSHFALTGRNYVSQVGLRTETVPSHVSTFSKDPFPKPRLHPFACRGFNYFNNHTKKTAQEVCGPWALIMQWAPVLVTHES